MTLLIKNNADHVEIQSLLNIIRLYMALEVSDSIVNGLNKKATQFDCLKYLEVGGLSIIYYKGIVFIQPLACLDTDDFTKNRLNIDIN